MHSFESKKIRNVTIAVLGFLGILYLGQGVIIKLRLNQLSSEKVEMTPTSEFCNSADCTATWNFVPGHRFLLLGNILRTHRITNLRTGEEIQPITQVRGTVADSWVRLRVYSVNSGTMYQLSAIKPKATKLDYFVGVLPRTTDHEGVLSIPDIGPTTAMISGLLGIFLLLVISGSAFIGKRNSSADQSKIYFELKMTSISSFFGIVVALISLGILDTLFPEGEVRNKILRVPLVIGLFLPAVMRVSWLKKGNVNLKVGMTCGMIAGTSIYFWDWIRGGQVWATVLSFAIVLGVVSFLRMKQKFVAFLWSGLIIDALKIFGLFRLDDYPPIYFYNTISLSCFTILAGNLGGFETIAMAGQAYRRFKRDLILSSIQKILDDSTTDDSATKVSRLQAILPDLAMLAGAGRVSITINLPLGRPITQSYDVETSNVSIFDDGKIPGALTLRTIIYGDEAMFESFEDFADRLRLPVNEIHKNSRYFCAVPLKVNHSIVGTLILTKFNDEYLHKRKNAGQFDILLSEEREIIHLIAERLSHSLSRLMVQDLSSSVAMSRSLHSVVHRVIGSSSGADDFLHRFVVAVAQTCGVWVMIHEKNGDKAVALAHSGLPKEGWDFFLEFPFNLSVHAVPAYGPTVVAFRDKKSSYVKDVNEISERLHQKTQTILKSMNVRSLAAIPLTCINRSFVVTVFTSQDRGIADPGITSVIESIEALFVAAIEVMSQKTSVLALGQLASRLIGDDEVRGKILDAAKSTDLPTTIGCARTSFLLLFDLVGSSNLSQDTEVKAKAYGDFYDAVNRKSQMVLGGMIRKTIGDAVIVTWDGTDSSLDECSDLIENLEEVVVYANGIAKSIGCSGVRAILHHGRYFLGLVGTQTFGQIDVIGSGIDEVCKMESAMKNLNLASYAADLGISDTAMNQLKSVSQKDFQNRGYSDVSSFSAGRNGIKFAASFTNRKKAVNDAA